MNVLTLYEAISKMSHGEIIVLLLLMQRHDYLDRPVKLALTFEVEMEKNQLVSLETR